MMRILVALIFTLLIPSCAIIYNGVITNNYPNSIVVDSLHGADGLIAESKNVVEVPVFETQQGTCISVSTGTQTKYYLVPSPPKWAKISGIWDVKFGLSVSPEGAFYVGKDGKSQKLKEVTNCNTQ
jgi:hypothetical protein